MTNYIVIPFVNSTMHSFSFGMWYIRVIAGGGGTPAVLLRGCVTRRQQNTLLQNPPPPTTSSKNILIKFTYSLFKIWTKNK